MFQRFSLKWLVVSDVICSNGSLGLICFIRNAINCLVIAYCMTTGARMTRFLSICSFLPFFRSSFLLSVLSTQPNLTRRFSDDVCFSSAENVFAQRMDPLHCKVRGDDDDDVYLTLFVGVLWYGDLYVLSCSRRRGNINVESIHAVGFWCVLIWRSLYVVSFTS